MAQDNEVPPALSSPEPHRAVPAPFLTKTYQLVDDPPTNDVVSWGADDCTFVVWKPMEFARDLLPLFFKHNNFSSFVRQLNTYGFRKTVPDRWEFGNDNFRKGAKQLLCEIHRRKTTTNSIMASQATPPLLQREERSLSSTSPTSSTEDVVTCSPPASPSPFRQIVTPESMAEENERLRRDNAVLVTELARIRHLYVDVVVILQHQQARMAMDPASGKWTHGSVPWHHPYAMSGIPMLLEKGSPLSVPIGPPSVGVSCSSLPPSSPRVSESSGDEIESRGKRDVRERILEDAVAHMKQNAAGYHTVSVDGPSGFRPVVPFHGGHDPSRKTSFCKPAALRPEIQPTLGREGDLGERVSIPVLKKECEEGVIVDKEEDLKLTRLFGVALEGKGQGEGVTNDGSEMKGSSATKIATESYSLVKKEDQPTKFKRAAATHASEGQLKRRRSTSAAEAPWLQVAAQG